MSVCVLHACKENHCDRAMIDQGGYPCGVWRVREVNMG